MQKNPNRSPYVLVCFQECERMNVLLREIRVSLQQLDLGLKVSLKVRLEQPSSHSKILCGLFFSLQGRADAVSWHGSPAVCAESRRSTRELERTGVPVYLRPGPVVSTPRLLLPAIASLTAGLVFGIMPRRDHEKCTLWLYSAITVQTTTSSTWVKGKNQLKVRLRARFEFCFSLNSYLILDNIPDLSVSVFHLKNVENRIPSLSGWDLNGHGRHP